MTEIFPTENIEEPGLSRFSMSARKAFPYPGIGEILWDLLPTGKQPGGCPGQLRLLGAGAESGGEDFAEGVTCFTLPEGIFQYRAL